MSAASGMIRSSRALLYAARSAAAAASKPGVSASPSKKVLAAATPKPPKAPAKKKDGPPSGLMKSKPISLALQDFVGAPEISRVEAVKKIWAHIKLNNLQNPGNKKEIFCDEKLKKLFEGKDKVGFLEVGKLLSPHFVKTA